MQKKLSRTELALMQYKQLKEKDVELPVVISKPIVVKTETIKLNPTRIKAAKSESGTIQIINKLQDEHFLVLFEIVHNKVYWCEGHYKYLTKKDCPIRTYIGPIAKPVKESRYMYITKQIQSIPKLL